MHVIVFRVPNHHDYIEKTLLWTKPQFPYLGNTVLLPLSSVVRGRLMGAGRGHGPWELPGPFRVLISQHDFKYCFEKNAERPQM